VGRGSGFREPLVFDVPTDADASRRKFQEEVEIIRRAWTGEPFSFAGEFYRLPELILVPKPSRQPAPIWIGSHTESSAVYAARAGLPYACATWPFEGVELQRSKLETYRRVAAESGLDVSSFSIPHFQFMYCGESDAEAAEFATRYMYQHQYILEAHYQYSRHSAERGLYGGSPAAMTEIDRITREALTNQLIGSPKTLVERIRSYRSRVDFDYLVAVVGWGNAPQEKTMQSVRRFTEEVMPNFDVASPPPAAAVGASAAGLQV
jgi:alkanesulfonate monooxygenase SsuD/methylene tetrahydromethanopterin reductase-like flavin-dependent oxidoreductase (luciferase family)